MLGQLFKLCTEQYSYTCTDPAFKNLSVNVETGVSIVLPIAALEHDETYFKSPHEYIPERFLEKTEHNKNCHLPFGDGPRSCLGK